MGWWRSRPRRLICDHLMELGVENEVVEEGEVKEEEYGIEDE